MPDLPGTVVRAPIRPGTDLDTFPSAIANEIAGGWHNVTSIAERDAIPAERLVPGMACRVADTALYEWNGTLWVALDLGGGAASPLSGDLGGTTTDGYVKTVRGVSGTFSYDGQNRLVFMSTALGTKTYSYNPDGTLDSITGTGSYRSKQFTYSGGLLVDVVVS